MASFNRVMLLGHLTRDPQLKYLPSQTAVAEFGLAVNRKFKTQAGEEREEVTFVDCAAFAKQAEVINQYCRKGKPLMLEGKLRYESWEDKQGGGKRSKLTVVVENFQFLGGRDDDSGGGSGGNGGDARRESAGAFGGQSRPPARGSPAGSSGGGQSRGRPPPGRTAEEPPFGDEQVFKEDDIPFAWEGRDSNPV